MKCLFICSILCFGLSVSTTAQHMDMQWYILQKNGLEGSELNNFDPNDYVNQPSIWKNEIGTPFAIHGIHPPNTGIDARAADDLFIIYNSGEYFSSRYLTPVWTYGESYEIGEASINLALPENQQISYMYFTNKYDVDDLPEKVRVNNDIVSEPDILEINEFLEIQNSIYDEGTTSQNLYIQSSQDVVPRKDITLIIYTANLSGNYTITHNKLIRSKYVSSSGIDSTQAFISNDIFTPSRIFEDQNFIFPDVNILTSSAEKTNFTLSGLTEQNHPKHIFVNLRASEELEKYLPTIHDSFHVIYELLDQNGSVVARHTDPNRPSHDPNEIVLSDVCVECRSAYYKGQFHNETPNPANGLAFAFNFPPEINGSSYKIVELKVNGNPTIATKDSVNNNRLFVKLADSLSIRSSRTRVNKSFGKVEFAICVKFNDEVIQDTMERGSFLTSQGLTHFNHGFKNLEKTYKLNSRDGTQKYNGDSFDRIVNSHCSACDILCEDSPPVKCKWYNCSTFWFEDFRWLYGLLGMGLLAGIIYKLLQKDKQRIR